jgi:CrcB protein
VSAAAWLGVAALGGIGAVLRYVVDAAITMRTSRVLPWGIFAVNLSGAFAIGLLDGRAPVVALGLLGAYTTFSTWMLQLRVLQRDGRRRTAITYAVAGLLLGLLAVWLGRGLAS